MEVYCSGVSLHSVVQVIVWMSLARIYTRSTCTSAYHYRCRLVNLIRSCPLSNK